MRNLLMTTILILCLDVNSFVQRILALRKCGFYAKSRDQQTTATTIMCGHKMAYLNFLDCSTSPPPQIMIDHFMGLVHIELAL